MKKAILRLHPSGVRCGPRREIQHRWCRVPRVQAAADTRKGNQRGACRVRVERCDTGEHLDVERVEDEAFWTWATVEPLRHTGLRHEGLLGPAGAHRREIVGHNDLNPTQTYVAVYNDDVLRRHRSFIALRPGGEYRDPTPKKWTEFEQHFTKRKVELCGLRVSLDSANHELAQMRKNEHGPQPSTCTHQQRIADNDEPTCVSSVDTCRPGLTDNSREDRAPG